MADLDDISIGKYPFTHSLAVHVKPIAAVEISDREYTRIPRNAGMSPGGAADLQNQTGICRTAHDQLVHSEFEDARSSLRVLNHQPCHDCSYDLRMDGTLCRDSVRQQ